MGRLHFLRAVAPRPSPATACLAAFERELDYIFWTLQRLEARPLDIEDLLQDMFAVLHRNWPSLDTTRPLRPWLFSVAFRLVRTYRRRQFRETLRDGLDLPDGGLDPEGRLQDRQSLTLRVALSLSSMSSTGSRSSRLLAGFRSRSSACTRGSARDGRSGPRRCAP